MGEALITRRGGGYTKMEPIFHYDIRSDGTLTNPGPPFYFSTAAQSGYLNNVGETIDFDKYDYLIYLMPEGSGIYDAFLIKRGQVIDISDPNRKEYVKIFEIEVNPNATDPDYKITIREVSEHGFGLTAGALIALS